ncbi:MAG: hypothetical protein RL701_2649, partial [Pseudomonadota bacterium]
FAVLQRRMAGTQQTAVLVAKEHTSHQPRAIDVRFFDQLLIQLRRDRSIDFAGFQLLSQTPRLYGRKLRRAQQTRGANLAPQFGVLGAFAVSALYCSTRGRSLATFRCGDRALLGQPGAIDARGPRFQPA